MIRVELAKCTERRLNRPRRSATLMPVCVGGRMYTEALFAAVVVVIVVTGGFFHLRSKRTRATASSRVDNSLHLSTQDREAALERVRAAVDDLLQGVSGNLSTIEGDAQRYGRALAEHRESLERIATVEDLRELEQRLLEQVKDVQAANDRYRRELDASNRTVAEQQRELERLRQAAAVDFLTELPNRRQLDERMREEMGRAKRHNQRFSLVVFDLDHFKRINDEFGHAAGDRVLRAIAQLLHDQKRASDFLARYGGEEFVMLLPETPLENALRLAEKIRRRVHEAEFQFQKQRVRVTLSAGVGEVAPESDSSESLFDRVDAALYQAKREGRDRVCSAATPTVPT
jgi:diguanylate cyclase